MSPFLSKMRGKLIIRTIERRQKSFIIVILIAMIAITIDITRGIKEAMGREIDNGRGIDDIDNTQEIIPTVPRTRNDNLTDFKVPHTRNDSLRTP